MLPEQPLIVGATLLRAWNDTDGDAEFLVQGWSDPAVARWSPRAGDRSLQAARGVVRMASMADETASSIDLVVADAVDGRALGEVGASRVDRDAGTAVVGWWLLEPARGHGHGVRAVNRFVQWLFEEVGLVRLAAVVASDNAASLVVAERAGFRRGAITPAGEVVFERRCESAIV